MKRVLIAGSDSFVGSHLCDRFAQNGYQVLAASYHSTHNQAVKVPADLPHIRHVQLGQLLKAGDTGTIDQIVHCGFPGSPLKSNTPPAAALREETSPTAQLLRLASEKKARIVMALPAHAMADPLAPLLPGQQYNHHIGPTALYDAARRFQESLFRSWHSRYGTNIGIARLYNPYGPRMPMNVQDVLTILLRQALSHEHFTVVGTGEQYRSYCYIQDIAEGVFRFANSTHQQAIDLGSPERISILNLAHLVLTLSRTGQRIEFSPSVTSEELAVPDFSRTEELIGWRPTVSLQEGIAATYRYLRQPGTGQSGNKSSVQIL
ncbi:MAG: NAD-dependent epimerase/dehydratase family protein [Cyclobacteriaceae bacterium]|nr:NAD-dependent epimerase/dehydratase family protein [Cyclobacteriaceae bacterium]